MKLTADCSKLGALRAEVLETPSKLPSAVKASSRRPWGPPQRRNEPRAAMCLVPTACHAGGGRGLSVPPGVAVRGLAPSWGAFDFSSSCPRAPHIVSHPSLSSTSSTSSPHSQWTAWLSMSLTNRRELPRAPHTLPCTRHAPRLPPSPSPSPWGSRPCSYLKPRPLMSRTPLIQRSPTSPWHRRSRLTGWLLTA